MAKPRSILELLNLSELPVYDYSTPTDATRVHKVVQPQSVRIAQSAAPTTQVTPVSYTTPADAVNSTLRVSGINYNTGNVRKQQQAVNDQRQAIRAEYRKRVPNGKYMTDAQVDRAIALEAESARNQAQVSQGYASPYTEEQRQQAANMAQLHNNFILGGHQVNPQYAYYNPGYAYNLINQDANILLNALLGAYSFNAPSLTATTLNAARQGLNTASNVATRVWNAAAGAAKNAGTVVTNPRWAATTGMFWAPTIMEAADGSTQNSGGFWNWVGNHPWETMALAAGAYKLGRSGFNWTKGKLRLPAEPEGRPIFKEVEIEKEINPYPQDRIPWTQPKEPVITDFQTTMTLEKPADFALPEPLKPGPKPTGGKGKKAERKLAEWEAKNKKYQEWQQAKADYDAQMEQYQYSLDHPEIITDQERFEEAKREYPEDLARWEQREAERAEENARYDSKQAEIDAKYDKDVKEQADKKAAWEKANKEYEESEAYKKYLERIEYIKKLRHKAWAWPLKNSYWIVPAAGIGYKWFTGGYGSNTENNTENNTDKNSTPVDSVQFVTMPTYQQQQDNTEDNDTITFYGD